MVDGRRGGAEAARVAGGTRTARATASAAAVVAAALAGAGGEALVGRVLRQALDGGAARDRRAGVELLAAAGRDRPVLAAEAADPGKGSGTAELETGLLTVDALGGFSVVLALTGEGVEGGCAAAGAGTALVLALALDADLDGALVTVVRAPFRALVQLEAAALHRVTELALLAEVELIMGAGAVLAVVRRTGVPVVALLVRQAAEGDLALARGGRTGGIRTALSGHRLTLTFDAEVVRAGIPVVAPVWALRGVIDTSALGRVLGVGVAGILGEVALVVARTRTILAGAVFLVARINRAIEFVGAVRIGTAVLGAAAVDVAGVTRRALMNDMLAPDLRVALFNRAGVLVAAVATVVDVAAIAGGLVTRVDRELVLVHTGLRGVNRLALQRVARVDGAEILIVDDCALGLDDPALAVLALHAGVARDLDRIHALVVDAEGRHNARVGPEAVLGLDALALSGLVVGRSLRVGSRLADVRGHDRYGRFAAELVPVARVAAGAGEE